MGQRCIMCCTDRRLVVAEPVTKQYEIQLLECPDCKSLLRLVQRRAVAPKCEYRASVRRATARIVMGRAT